MYVVGVTKVNSLPAYLRRYCDVTETRNNSCTYARQCLLSSALKWVNIEDNRMCAELQRKYSGKKRQFVETQQFVQSCG